MNLVYLEDSIALLRSMIRIPSLSREEGNVATLIEETLTSWGYKPYREGNNVWIFSSQWNEDLPVILLDSHIDTVRPGKAWIRDPFGAELVGDKLYGLGSNDAGASVVSLLCAFRNLEQKPQPYNLIFCASAEEEVSGLNGIASVFEQLGKINLAVVGEPTRMNMAIAEKGLVVLDCEAKGIAGHAARNEGENAIFKAMADIKILSELSFPKESPILGPVKITVTQMEAGTQHNVVPDSCRFVADVRTNECYTNQEVYQIIDQAIESEVTPRSFRLNSSGISPEHPIVKRGISIGLTSYGSPTTSDQAVIPCTSMKIGPGDSARSHTADEYIFLDEIRKGVEIYIMLLDQLEL